MARKIRFANQFPAVDEPLLLVPGRGTFGEVVITLRELDTYVQDGRRHHEGGESRDLGAYVARVQGGKFTKAAYVVRSPEEWYPKPGYFDGYWNELRLFHKEGETEVTGRYPGTKDGRVTGKVSAGGKALELRWSQSDGKQGGWYFDLLDENTIKGVWWYDYGSRRQTREQVEELVADGEYAHLDYFKRAKPYTKAQPLFKIPVSFKGVDAEPLIACLPAEELAAEIDASLRDRRTRRTKDAVLLEVGLFYNYRGVKYKSERYFAEVPVPIDRELEKGLAEKLVFHRGWMLGSGLKQKEPGLEAELKLLGTVLVPDKADFAAQPAFAGPFEAGKKAGLKDRKALAESLIVRLASGGFLPTDDNPLPKDTPLYLEFEVYRTLGNLVEKDCVVEVYEHARGDKRWPGRTWSLLPGYKSALLGHFGDDCASAVRVPQGFEIELYSEAGQEGQKLKLGPGLHNLAASGFNDKATGILVRCSTPPEQEQDFRVRAFRQGRVLLRVSQAAAMSDGETIPSELFAQAYYAGVSRQDVEAIFRSAFEAATNQRTILMVKTYASLGYGPASKNPYTKSGKKKLQDEFERFLKACAESKPGIQRALKEGQEIFKLFDRGIAVGKKSFSAAGAESFIRQQADRGKIGQDQARKHYKNGLEVGKAQRGALCSQLWFGSQSNTKKFQEALLQVAQECAAHPDTYGDPRDPNARLYGDGFWSPLRELRRQAIAAGVPEKTFIIARNRALRTLIPATTSSAGLQKVALAFFSEPAEWLGLTVWALVDTIQYGVCSVAGWELVPYENSQWYIEQCRAYFESSAFDRIDQAETGWGLYAMAVLGLGDAFFKVGAAMTGWGALRNVGNLRAAGFTFKTFMQTLVVGGVEFTGGNLGKLLVKSAALGSVLGFGEEAIHAGIDEREFQLSSALWKTLRNSVMFLFFQGGSNFFTMLSMGEAFAAIVFLPQVAGLVASGAQLIEGYKTDDDKKKKEAWKYLAQEAFSTVLTMGVPAITRILANRFLASRVAQGGPLTKLAQKIRAETVVKLPDPDDAPGMVRFLLFHVDDAKALGNFIAKQSNWDGVQSKLSSQFAKTRSGTLTPGAKDILQKTRYAYLRTYGGQSARVCEFLQASGATKSYAELKAIGDALPHGVHPIKPWKRKLTQEGDEVWRQLVHHFLSLHSDDASMTLRLHGEIGVGGLRTLKKRLAKHQDGDISDASLKIWHRLMGHVGDAGHLNRSHEEFGGYQLRKRIVASREGVAWTKCDLHNAAAEALGKKTVSKQEAFDHFMASTKVEEVLMKEVGSHGSTKTVAHEVNPKTRDPSKVVADVRKILDQDNVLAFSHEDLGPKAVGLFKADDENLIHVFGFHGIETGFRSQNFDADFVMMKDPVVTDGILIHHSLLFEMLTYAHAKKSSSTLNKTIKLYTCGAGWNPQSGIGHKVAQHFRQKTIAPGETLGTPVWSQFGFWRWTKGTETIAKGRTWETSLPD